MKERICAFLLSVLVIVSAAGCRNVDSDENNINNNDANNNLAEVDNNIAEVEIGGEVIYAEIADNQLEREKGLMKREELCWNCGMLFVFEEEGKHGFWMKDTRIELDMIFIDDDMKIVEVHQAEPFDMNVYVPENKARYVLEVNRGRFKDAVGKKIVMD